MKLSPFKTLLLFLVLITTGAALVPSLPIKLQTSKTLPSVTVLYSWNPATGRVIEREVTSRLEGLFSKVGGVKNLSSLSSAGRGYIGIEFDEQTDFDAARFEISTLIRQAYPRFPQGVSYPWLSVNRPDQEDVKPLITYTINAPVSPVLIERYAQTYIKPRLSLLKGVRQVEIYGATPMEWVLEYDANLLKAQGISSTDIPGAINRYLSKSDAGIGLENTPRSDTSMIHLVLRNYDPNNLDFLNLPVKKVGGRIVHLKDIVTMRHEEQKPNSYYRINGANSISIVLYADEFANQLKLSDQVKDRMSGLQAQLPSGYFLLSTFDSTDKIREDLTKNARRTFFTLLLLLFFVLVVTRQLRYLVLIVFSLMADVAISVIFYSIFKLEISFYSFAGIAISLGLMLENNIVMIEYYRRYKNRRIFMAILSATLTTIAALLSVFFLEERLGLNLMEFSKVITINLIASLLVALFLIPSLMDKMPLRNPGKGLNRGTGPNRGFLPFGLRPKRRLLFTLYLTRFYEQLIFLMLRFRKSFIVLAILAFGLPLFLLPLEMSRQGVAGSLYNKTLGSEWYGKHIKPVAEKALGGTLRLFVQDVYEKSGYKEMQQTLLNVNARLPYGSTIDQMNELMKSLEKYLLDFKEIKQFQTSINGGQYAQMSIYFKKEYEKNGFPAQLKDQIVRKSIDLGGADWSVTGVGEGFNNSVSESIGSSRIKMFGFNYEELSHWVEVAKKSLLMSPRIKEVSILSREAWEKDNSFEFVMDVNREKLISQNGSPLSVYNSLKGYDLDENTIASTVFDGALESIRMAPLQNKTMDIWQLQRLPNQDGKSMVRMQDISSIQKEPVSLDIVKKNQQYCMILAYNFIGSESQGERVQNRVLKELHGYLPLGYTAESENRQFLWNDSSKKQYWLLCLVILAIYFICSILFESLRHPLAVIAMIPFSYIGLFLTFYLFDLNFDQGGFAAFIMLSGLTINSALYLINDYDILKRAYAGRTISSYRLYLKAFNRNIRTILLSISAIILGLVPFLSGGADEVFWPALAGGTIGGLLFSIVGLVLLLPLILLKKPPYQKRKEGKIKKAII